MLKAGDKVRALRRWDAVGAAQIPRDAVGTVVHAYEAKVEPLVRPGTRIDVDFGRHGVLTDRPATEFELIDRPASLRGQPLAEE